jgi:hypothetical protein
MPLHRDIYWVGRQWAVTGYGMQAIDQRLKGKFDIEVSRLCEDGLPASLQSEKWFNIEDFSKGLSVARSRHPELAGKMALTEKTAREKIAPPEQAVFPLKDVSPPNDDGPVERPKSPAQKFDMRIESWPAKLVSSWRIRR